jgi:glycine/D-amino acid oxidase-like deaminating enzyme
MRATRPVCWTARSRPKVRAAYLVEGEGVADPEGLAPGLGEALDAAGVKVHENAEVTGFRSGAGRVTALRIDRCEIPCSAVVVAAGMRSPALLRELGRRLPLQAGKGYSFAVGLDPAPRQTLYSASAGPSRHRSAPPPGSAARWN